MDNLSDEDIDEIGDNVSEEGDFFLFVHLLFVFEEREERNAKISTKTRATSLEMQNVNFEIFRSYVKNCIVAKCLEFRI